MSQQILLFVAGFKASPIRVAYEPGSIEHQDHALRVVQDIFVEVTLAAIAAFGRAPVGDVFQNVNGAQLVFRSAVDARSRDKKSSVSSLMNEFLMRGLRVPAERTKS